MSIINFRHLHSAITNFTGNGLGNCFQRSVAMVMDWPKARLVVGTMTDPDADHDYIHCWVEAGEVDYDPSRFEDHGELLAFDREVYRLSNKARDIVVLTRKEVLDFAKEGKLSAWMLKPHVSAHEFKGVMGEVLLKRIGYPFVVNEQGGILPNSGLKSGDRAAT